MSTATAEPPAPPELTASASVRAPLLRSLGIVGYDPVEPVVLASIATETPLLLIGPHGTAKSLLLCRLAQALGLAWRHYNASLVNYDDLIGYPLPDSNGKLSFVQTPASIWDAEVVFVDELSRARPDMLNRLFPIIHERVVQGMPLPRLRHRWAAMNPPTTGDSGGEAAVGSSTDYLGSEPLDPALADRFGFVLSVPTWNSLTVQDKDSVITKSGCPLADDAGCHLIETINSIRREIPLLEEWAGSAISEAVRELMGHAAKLGLTWSGRRSAMLYRNILAVHAAALVQRPTANLVESSWLAVSSSIPQRAQGSAFDSRRLLIAHNSVWKTVRLDSADPRRGLACESDAVRRALRAAQLPQLSMQERSVYIADALAQLPAGGRHALGYSLVESGAAAECIAAVAEQCAELFATVAGRQDIHQSMHPGSARYQAWRAMQVALEKQPADADTPLIANLLPALHSAGQLVQPRDVDSHIASWREVRALCAKSAASVQNPEEVKS